LKSPLGTFMELCIYGVGKKWSPEMHKRYRCQYICITYCRLKSDSVNRGFLADLVLAVAYSRPR
jgi:hypothetical protein